MDAGSGDEDLKPARFESMRKETPPLASNQYVILPSVAKRSANYASPNDVPIPAENAHYAEFIDAKKLMEMNQEAAPRTGLDRVNDNDSTRGKSRTLKTL